ncbi:MAG TPA: response regulator [Polyangiales bacterium]
MHEADTILVIDDNPGSLKLARVLLQRNGYRVHTAADAREALALLEGCVPRLILLDLQLPGIDGYELCRRLKVDLRTHHIPIIALTAYAMKGDVERARAAGCDDYVTKPLDTQALPKLISEHLGRTRAARDRPS